MAVKTPVFTFIRSCTSKPVPISELIRERALNITTLKEQAVELHPIVQETVQKNREFSRKAASRGEIIKFIDGDIVLVVRENFGPGEKLYLRWHGLAESPVQSLTTFTQLKTSETGKLKMSTPAG